MYSTAHHISVSVYFVFRALFKKGDFMFRNILTSQHTEEFTASAAAAVHVLHTCIHSVN